MGATARVVDLSNVKEGGNFSKKRVPSGDYLAKITKVEDAVSKSDQTPQYLFTIKLEKVGNAVYPYYCKLQENQLWKLRNLLIAGGKNVPKKKMKVDPNVVVGKLIGVTMSDTEYNDQEQSEIDAVFPASELDDSGTSAPEPEEDDDEDVEDEDDSVDVEDDEADDEEEEDEAEDNSEAARLAGLSRNELKAELVKLQPGFQARKSQTDDDLRDLIMSLSSGDEEEDDEEEEEKPAPKASTKKKTSRPKASDVTDEELDELNIDDL